MTTKEVKVNVNDNVRVKLTALGRRIYQDVWKSNPPQVDSEGYSQFQMWDLMRTYGDHLYLGGDLLFETEMIVLTSNNTEESIQIQPHTGLIAQGSYTATLLTWESKTSLRGNIRLLYTLQDIPDKKIYYTVFNLPTLLKVLNAHQFEWPGELVETSLYNMSADWLHEVLNALTAQRLPVTLTIIIRWYDGKKFEHIQHIDPINSSKPSPSSVN